jgi:ribosomal protein S18 acetylase RimI-like enzyme
MKAVIRRDYALLVATIMLVVGTLSLISALRPESFGFFVGILGTTGALLVIYEVHHTKRIAQATFVRDLNTAFTTDESISELWRKLLLDENIDKSDRPRISSYLTFFETVYLLLDRKVIDLRLLDNLFRNRFFTAIGNEQIQTMTLLSQPGTFLNIHALIKMWSEFLAVQGVPQHNGYYEYIKAAALQDGYSITQLRLHDLEKVLTLEEEVFAALSHSEWLRKNDQDVWAECLDNQLTIGATDRDGNLVALAVLFDAGSGPESISRYLSSDHPAIANSLNLKIVLVAPSAQRSGLARTLVELLEFEATHKRRQGLLCTIHRSNIPSKHLFTSLGYTRVGRAETLYGRRDIYLRSLALPSRKQPRHRRKFRLVRTAA